MQSQPISRRLGRIALWVGGVAVAIFVLDLLGIPVRGWIEELFDKQAQTPTLRRFDPHFSAPRLDRRALAGPYEFGLRTFTGPAAPI